MPCVARGLNDVVFKNGRAAKGAKNADGEHRDGNRSGHGEPGAQAHVDRNRPENKPEKAAEKATESKSKKPEEKTELSPFVRIDFCEACWAEGKRPTDPLTMFSFWKTTVPVPEQKSNRREIPIEVK